MITMQTLFSMAREQMSSCMLAIGDMAVMAVSMTLPRFSFSKCWNAFIMCVEWLAWPEECFLLPGR